MAQAFAELSVAQIQAGLTAKEFSAKEVAESSLARIASADKAVHAFLETTEEAALAAAARVDAAIAAQHEPGRHPHHLLFPHVGKLCFALYRNVRK